MNKIVLTAILTMLTATTAFCENGNPVSDNYRPFRVQLKFIPEFLTGGSLGGMSNSLSYTADSIPIVYYGIEMDYYLFNFLGIMAGYDFLGSMQYIKYEQRAVNISSMSRIILGIIGKFTIFNLRDESSSFSKNLICDLKLCAGMNYGFFDYQNDYKTNKTSMTYYTGPASGLGFYAGGGLEFLFSYLMIGAQVYFNYNNFNYSAAASRPFSMITIEVPIYIGLAF